MRYILFSFVFGLSIAGKGQSAFTSSATLPPIDSTGFYRIALTSDVCIHLNNNFTGLRLYNEKEQEVPFLFEEEKKTTVNRFSEYEILEKTQKRNCCTTLVLHNPERNSINNISLIIKNADVLKTATLLGSDNREQWYALKQHVQLDGLNNARATADMKMLNFPWSNYSYYKLEIDDSTTAPLNILRAGYYQLETSERNYSVVPIKLFSQVDSVDIKKTYITIRFDTVRLVDRLEFTISGLPYFSRNATLYKKGVHQLRNGSTESYLLAVHTFQLRSDQENIVSLPTIRSNEFIVIIENLDNPPVQISAVNTFQLNRYITAWLEKENSYTLRLGNINNEEPNYDLAQFKDKIPQQPPVLNVSKIESTKTTAPKSDFVFFTSRTLIWAILFIVILALGWMSIRMVKEAEKK
ncbi:MAG: hypothetical protein JNM57_11860 [Cyclobacteriaceae bacterium]|nr:hypothetical protein [Cyclobacteriaceae bacterium]